MPYVKIQTNRALDPARRAALAGTVSAWTAEQLGKSEAYVMTNIQPDQFMTFAGDDGPCAYVELKSLGLNETQTTALSHGLCALLQQELDIDPARVYIEFSASPRPLWGWNSKTF